MTESKIDAIDRLRAEGLENEASKYRTERRIQYRNAGMAKKDAKEKAWDDMLSKYPPPGVNAVEPLEIKMPEEKEEEPEEEFVHIPATDMDVAGDIAWAYEHLGDDKVRADQAPSAGAWNMLIYGRGARYKFLELVTKYDQSAKGDDDEAFEADAAVMIKDIDKLLAITDVVHYEAVLDAIRQSPGEVVKALREAGWGVTRPAEKPLESTGVEV